MSNRSTVNIAAARIATRSNLVPVPAGVRPKSQVGEDRADAGTEVLMSHWDLAQSALLPMPTFASSDGRRICANEAAGQLGMHWPRDQGRPLADFLCSIDG